MIGGKKSNSVSKEMDFFKHINEDIIPAFRLYRKRHSLLS